MNCQTKTLNSIILIDRMAFIWYNFYILVKRGDFMNYIISGKNIDVTEGLRAAVYDKLGRLEKFFTEDTKAQVTFSVEKERQKIEVTIPMKGHIIRAEQVSDDMYVSIDMVVEIIERQVVRYKKKIVDQNQDAAYFQDSFLDEEYEDEGDDIQIIRSKRFAVKPMYPEDACVQMELLGHNFYVFRNAETDEVNVVYKRKGNTYGLIEPEF
jgi:putative sigma-54 modulation protein